MNDFVREAKDVVLFHKIFGGFEDFVDDAQLMNRLVSNALLDVPEDEAFALEHGLIGYAGRLMSDEEIAEFRNLSNESETKRLRAQAINRLGDEMVEPDKRLGGYETLLDVLKIVAWYRLEYRGYESTEEEIDQAFEQMAADIYE
ncbi:MAG: hypothetical protein BRC25_01645 [Parcubacteria group bacterium SW_6_46_9]|nr:MAG: hypothetical protein BRC25_01645 [Parcubacteria group bacterium SW_6_46_9]